MSQVLYATGRRKESIARAYIQKGKGVITVNDKVFEEYFTTPMSRNEALSPLVLLNLKDKFDVKLFIKGGGVSGQGGAAKLAISRVLASLDQEYNSVLRSHDFLTRDSRTVERKHYGLKKARRAPQSSKR